MPVWPDCAQGRPPAPASRLLMALEAAHTPTSCHVAKHTHAGLRSVGARKQTSPWRASPLTTCARPYPSLKWRARRQPLILVSRTQTHSNASRLEKKCRACSHTLSFTHNALWPVLSDLLFFSFSVFAHRKSVKQHKTQPLPFCTHVLKVSKSQAAALLQESKCNHLVCFVYLILILTDDLSKAQGPIHKRWESDRDKIEN